MTKIATTAIIYHGGKILIGRRRRDGRWELPGGKIDPGETPEACIVREINEELDLDVRIERFLGIVEGMYRGILMKVWAYVTVCDNPAAAVKVHEQIRWIDPAEAAAFDIVEEDALVLQRWRQDKGPA